MMMSRFYQKGKGKCTRLMQPIFNELYRSVKAQLSNFEGLAHAFSTYKGSS